MHLKEGTGDTYSAATPAGVDPESVTPRRPLISLAVPIFNEEETIPELASRIRSVMDPLEVDYEVIFVDDGSRDRSREMLREICTNGRMKLIGFSRNFGHQAALYAGLQRARGDTVVLMDGDLQDPPEVIPRMLDAWRGGFDVVYAVRRKRKEGVLKRAAYMLFYRLLSRIAYVEIPVDSGDFCLLDRKVANVLRDMPERNKFLRGLRSWVGFRQTSLEYERDARFAGESKFSLKKLLKLAFDGLISHSFVPLRVAFACGVIISISSFVLAIFYGVVRIVAPSESPQGFTTLAVLVLFLGGVQLISLGLIGEYVGRISDDVKGRPEFVEQELVGFGTTAHEERAGASGRGIASPEAREAHA